jgi:AcrR family transcriptional regulator
VPGRKTKRRAPLTRERVLRAAIAIADADGFDSLTMRRLAKKLGVEAMSLYNHVASKDDLLDGLIDIVFGEIDVPTGPDWRSAMRKRAISARQALMRHRWAIGLMEGRMQPGRENLRYHNAVMGSLREAGFAFRDAVHASSVLDAYIYGFALQERGLPFDTPEESAAVMQAQSHVTALDDYPYLHEVLTELPKSGYDFDAEFEYGLDLILDGLEKLVRP